MNDKCKWQYYMNDDYYRTECGEMFQFTADGPKENSFKFCPYCGKEIDDKQAIAVIEEAIEIINECLCVEDVDYKTIRTQAYLILKYTKGYKDKR